MWSSSGPNFRVSDEFIYQRVCYEVTEAEEAQQNLVDETCNEEVLLRLAHRGPVKFGLVLFRQIRERVDDLISHIGETSNSPALRIQRYSELLQARSKNGAKASAIQVSPTCPTAHTLSCIRIA